MLKNKIFVMKKNNASKLINEIRQVLLTEAKNTDIIINVIGLPSEISEWITNDYPEKFQLWIANNFKKEAAKRIANRSTVVENMILKMLKGDKTQPSLKNQLNRQKSYFQGMLQHIVGYIQGRREIAIETDDLNLKTLSFDEAVRRADAWQSEVQRLKAGQITDESGKIMKTYPDGFYWIDLQKSNCSAEARAMGHCGNAQGHLVSLRKQKQPHLTGDIYRTVLMQLRGRANTKPKAEYHEKIVDLLLDPNVGITSISPAGYRPNDNFELKDLSLENLMRLYSSKPQLFVKDELYKSLLKYPEFATQVNLRVTPLHQDQKEHLEKLHPEMKSLFLK